MAKIKHIALTTHDLEKVASFYKDVLGMAEVGRSGSSHIYLSDGDLNLTIRACKKSDDPDVGEQGENFGCVPPFTHGVSTRPMRLMKPVVIHAAPDVRFRTSSETPCRRKVHDAIL